MATYKYDHAVKVNGEMYPPNTDIEIPDRKAEGEAEDKKAAAESPKPEKKTASKKATKAEDKKAAAE